MKKSLTRINRKLTRSERRALFTEAQSFRNAGVKVLVRKNGLNHSRYMVAPVRSFGNAVRRNKAKRIAREILRKLWHEIREGFDLALVLWPGEYRFETRKQQIEQALERSGVLGRCTVNCPVSDTDSGS